MALTTLLALLAGCNCNSTNGTPDGGLDADHRADSDRDEDVIDSGAPDAEEPELCRGAGPAWSWPPCNDEPNPPDCCTSCRRLTCRELVSSGSGLASIWGDRVAYGYRRNVGLIDLATGEDRLVFERWQDETWYVSYHDPTISSRYIVVTKLYDPIDREGGLREYIVARNADDFSGNEIIVEDSDPEASHGFLRAYEDWVIWLRTDPSTRYNDLVLHNIETGEERILDQDRSGHGVRGPGIWGDRVVWGQRDEVKGETLVEHRISANTTRDVITDPDLEPMYSTSVWENFAVFNHQPDGGDWNAMLVDLDTGEVRRITPSGSNQDQARIQGGRVVWTDFRGASGGGPAGMHIYVYSLRTGREYVINPSARGSSEPLIFGQIVVWNGDWEGYSGPPWVTRIGDI